MKLTSDLFADFLNCPTKCYLHSTGQGGTGNAFADWVREQNEAYRNKAAQRLMETLAEGERALAAPDAANLKTARWRFATDFHVQTETMESRLHAVERVPPQGRGKPAQFMPLRFVFFNKLSKHDRLLMAFDALVMSEVLGREVSIGKIVHGDDHATLKVRIPGLLKTARKLIGNLTRLLADDSPPDLLLNRHCNECEFQGSCRQKAAEKDDLSLLPAMPEKERSKLHGKGIFTVHQLSFTFRPRKVPKRAKNPCNPRHHALHAQAIREETVYIHGNPHIPISERCLYFDIEGVPWRESYYLIGVLTVEPENTRYHFFWADGADQVAIITEFCRFMGAYHGAPLFHYGNYDVKALREMGRLIPADDRNALQNILSATFDVLPVVHSHIYFPLHSVRLRQAARFLGSEFAGGISSGMESIMFRER